MRPLHFPWSPLANATGQIALFAFLSACDSKTPPSPRQNKACVPTIEAAQRAHERREACREEAACHFRQMAYQNFDGIEGVTQGSNGSLIFSGDVPEVSGVTQAIVDHSGMITVENRGNPQSSLNVRCEDKNGDGRWDMIFPLQQPRFTPREEEAARVHCVQILDGVVEQYADRATLEWIQIEKPSTPKNHPPFIPELKPQEREF